MRSFIRSLAYALRTRPRLGRAALRLIPDLPVRVGVDGIGPLAIRLRRNRSFWLREPLVSEHFPFSMLRRMVRPGDVVYDAGANLGLYCRFLAGVLGAATVVAFEPVAENRLLLRRNLELGRIADRVRLLPYALSDEDGEALFQVDDRQSSSGTLDRVTAGEPSVGRKNLGLGPLTETVVSRRLDTVLRDEGLPQPALIKIDVEGAEALLLRGAARLLAEQGPKLLIELHGAPEARAVVTFLCGLGYACAGRVDPRIHPGGFGPVDRSTLATVQGMYDIHFLVAARDPGDLPASYSAEEPVFSER